MNLVYVDEVKFNPGQERYYWLFALAIPEDELLEIEKELGQIAFDYFGTRRIDKTTEFHGSDILHGKAANTGRELEQRIGLLKELTSVIDRYPNIGRIVIRLDPGLMTRSDHHAIAFMYLVERVEELMIARESLALLIVDRDRETTWPNVRDLAEFREDGTAWLFGRKITRLVDTVHHTDSHHSRLLQLVDVYAYAMSVREKQPAKYPRSEIVKHINGLSNFTWPTKFKFWPPQT